MMSPRESRLMDSNCVEVINKEDHHRQHDKIEICKSWPTTRIPTNSKLVRLAPHNVYVYKHAEHASCSSVHMSQVQACLVTNKQTEEIAECTSPEQNALLPFFYKNEHLLRIYKQSFRNGCSNIKPEIDKLEGILNGLGDACSTPFEAPLGPATGWQENDRTKRLIHGIRVTLPRSQVMYTAPMGTTWTTTTLPQLGSSSTV